MMANVPRRIANAIPTIQAAVTATNRVEMAVKATRTNAENEIKVNTGRIDRRTMAVTKVCMSDNIRYAEIAHSDYRSLSCCLGIALPKWVDIVFCDASGKQRSCRYCLPTAAAFLGGLGECQTTLSRCSRRHWKSPFEYA